MEGGGAAGGGGGGLAAGGSGSEMEERVKVKNYLLCQKLNILKTLFLVRIKTANTELAAVCKKTRRGR